MPVSERIETNMHRTSDDSLLEADPCANAFATLTLRKGVHHMVGLQARGAPAFNRVRDLVAEGYVGKVLSCTMIIPSPGDLHTGLGVHCARCAGGQTLADLPIPDSYRWVPPAVPTGLPFNVAQLYMRMAEGIREGKSVSPDLDVARQTPPVS